ncbi:Flavodoxin, putative [Angomonas deanei]|uniref:Flavodoxin, putative n=1 Tax=Angomonas deanei TaxID=59799 RepID=A0A7G2C156_9TRYP|nr:Flavodoxin, putative [Angomonas deanei]
MSTEKFLFLYGSETGNSESICKNLHNEAVKTKGFTDAQCMTMNSAISKKVLDEQTNEETAKPLCLVIVCSTTGEGEPPENAARFRRWLRNTKEKLFRVRHTLLALGDTNYNNFCSAGKYIDTKLSEFGSMRFFPRGEADDGVDLNLIVEPWTARVWDHIHNTTNAIGHEAFSATEQHYVDMSVAQEVAIVYANANHICASFALFMYERILELGGKANVYPVQYFNPTTVALEAKIVLFIFSTDVDEHTLCEACAAASNLPPPLGYVL